MSDQPPPDANQAAPVLAPAVLDEAVAVPAPPGTRRPSWLLPVATGVGGLLLGVALMAGVGAIRDAAGRSAAQAVLADAVEACGVGAENGIDLADGDTTLTFDMQGEGESSGADFVDIACIFGALDMPSNVSSHIDQTTSMDGRQTETWGDLSVSWSYHPDRGLDGVLTVAAE